MSHSITVTQQTMRINYMQIRKGSCPRSSSSANLIFAVNYYSLYFLTFPSITIILCDPTNKKFCINCDVPSSVGSRTPTNDDIWIGFVQSLSFLCGSDFILL